MNAVSLIAVLGQPYDQHVRTYLARLLRDAQHETRVLSAAPRYEAAMANERAHVAAITAAQQHPIEPTRWKRDVDKGQWRDPDDKAVLQRTPTVVLGYRRVDPMITMEKRNQITREHLAAAFKLRDDYEVGELGARPGSQRSEIRSTAACGGGPAEAQLDALARFRAAVQSVGLRLSGILLHVALDGATVTMWADARAMSLNKAMGYFEASLDRLVDHYAGELTLADLQRVNVVEK